MNAQELLDKYAPAEDYENATMEDRINDAIARLEDEFYRNMETLEALQ